jgi:hypothetical protein
VSELEFVINQEREETKRAQDAAKEQANQAQRHLEDKRQLRASLSEAQRETLTFKEEMSQVKVQLEEEKRLRTEEVMIRADYELIGFQSKFLFVE